MLGRGMRRLESWKTGELENWRAGWLRLDVRVAATFGRQRARTGKLANWKARGAAGWGRVGLPNAAKHASPS